MKKLKSEHKTFLSEFSYATLGDLIYISLKKYLHKMNPVSGSKNLKISVFLQTD